MHIKTLLSFFFTAILATSGSPFPPSARYETVSAASGHSTFSSPQNMGAGINTADMDQLPVAAANGLSLYFASNRTGGQGAQDIYVAQRATVSSAWGVPQNLGITVNTSANDTPSSLSPDGRELFIQSTRPGGIGGVDIYVTTRSDTSNDFGWTTPVNIGPVVNTTALDGFGNYFVDPVTGVGTLFFNSDRAGGLGGNDISIRNTDGSFNAPSLVSELNSSGTEERSTISSDGLEFFFSSNRIAPTTNQALFVSTRSSTSSVWSPPVHIAFLSSAGSNAQPVLSNDGSILYFVSNRAGGSGLGDIYSATRTSINRTPTADFDGDGRTDLTVFRPSNGTWHTADHFGDYRTMQWGQAGDIPVDGDFDGDGKNDFTLFRCGKWFILRSSDGTASVVDWGLPLDIPVSGDYDGDGRSDIGVYRVDTWYIIQSSNGHWLIQQFGISGDLPIGGSTFQ
jgi:hypothetical protein